MCLLTYLVKFENPKMLLILIASATSAHEMFTRTLWALDLRQTTTTTTNVMDYSAANHIVTGALYKNLDLKLLHSSMQTSADYRSRRRHVSRVTDEKGETWSPSGMSKVRSRPESVVADCSMHALAAATGKARSPRVARRVDGTCSVMVSAERRHRRPRSLMS